MNGQQEQDSGSDWDSLSEAVPSHPKVPSKASADIHDQPETKPQKLRSMLSPEQWVDQHSDNPPFDFKNELSSPIRASEQQWRPGKRQKGHTYDPLHQASRKQVVFSESHTAERVSASPATDPGEPLYSKIKPKNKSKNHSVFESPEEQNYGMAEPVELDNRRSEIHLTYSSPQSGGIDNQGFTGDGQVSANHASLSSDQTKISIKMEDSPPQAAAGHLHRPPYTATRLSPNGPCQPNSKDCDQLLVLLPEESKFQFATRQLLKDMNQTLRDVFAFITFPFSFVALLLHHVIRFVAQGLVRPLLCDTILVLTAVMLRPCVSTIVSPAKASVQSVVHAISDILSLLLRPLVSLCRACRMVEVNYNRQLHSLEEIQVV